MFSTCVDMAQLKQIFPADFPQLSCHAPWSCSCASYKQLLFYSRPLIPDNALNK